MTSALIDRTFPSDPEDALFSAPFVDIDEERTSPWPHRYVHGGFLGTDTRFSYYLPDSDAYEGRFFQHATPTPQSELLAQHPAPGEDKVGFALASGAYFVETNGGGPEAAAPTVGEDQSVGAFRANAAAARFSRVVASAIYGAHRPYGYLYGGSGGGYRTIGSSENTTDVWDGFVPYVIGSPLAIPNMFTVRMQAQRVLRDALPRIVDAYDAGGDPDSLELTAQERDAFDEVTRMGFPPRSWFGWRTMGMHAFSALFPGLMAADPSYVGDFWSTPGYRGADPASPERADRVQLETTLAELLLAPATPSEQANIGGVDEAFRQHGTDGEEILGLRLADRPEGWLQGAELTVTSAQDGTTRVLRLAGVDGDIALLEPGQDTQPLAVGDAAILDNGSFLAFQSYHRHQVPPEGYPAWEQFRDEAGDPLFPQRPFLLGPSFTANAAGTIPTGRISGRMIVVSCLLDREAFPWQADWYRGEVEKHLGNDAEDRFRLWYVDHGLHGDTAEQDFPTRTVPYLGALETALRRLAAWVERGEDPGHSTTYEIEEAQVVVPDSAGRRRGIQPVVALTANGRERTEVSVGERVLLSMQASTPPGAGSIVSIAWDDDGDGELGDETVVAPAVSHREQRMVTFGAPGTYIVAVRATAQTAGEAEDPFARLSGLARARIVVR
ncbi:hypothetical protein [Brachybacterium sp. AOP29-B2-41]|uniref:hypothetical protein n=1 Tax=Brachybacterium sp. AOP29-B2-41 TaxID=3457704 RepID=UPI0040335849